MAIVVDASVFNYERDSDSRIWSIWLSGIGLFSPAALTWLLKLTTDCLKNTFDSPNKHDFIK